MSNKNVIEFRLNGKKNKQYAMVRKLEESENKLKRYQKGQYGQNLKKKLVN